VSSWERVKALDPTHPEVDAHLATARESKALVDELARDTGPTTPRTPPADGKLRLRAVGDVMLGTTFPEGYLSPEDGKDVMRAALPHLRDADLTFANLEGPLCDVGETDKCKPGQNCYAFRSPERYGALLVDAGIDIASLANNHSRDFGEECRTRTEQVLDRHGIVWSGRIGSVARLEKNGVRVAMIAFHTGEAVHSVNDHDLARALVAREAKTHDVVIVSFHGGAEGAKAQRVPNGKETFYGENRGDLRKFTHAVVDAGADLVIGHGPHVLRGMEVYRDRLIAYSLGNFATYGRFNLSGPLGVSAILDVELDGEGRFLGGRLVPFRQVGAGILEEDPQREALGLVKKLSIADFPKTHVVVERDGSLRKK
jgi:hypothetical protein